MTRITIRGIVDTGATRDATTSKVTAIPIIVVTTTIMLRQEGMMTTGEVHEITAATRETGDIEPHGVYGDPKIQSLPFVGNGKGLIVLRGSTPSMHNLDLHQTLHSSFGSFLAMSDTYEKYAPDIVFGLDAPHLHLLTNHVPLFVTLSGLFVLAIGLLRKNRSMSQVALVLLLSGIVGGLITYWLGQQAYKPVRGLADEVGQDWLDLHMERAEKIIWFFWVAAASAGTALILAWKNSRFAQHATILAGICAFGTVALSGWIADAGGKIRHPELRGEAKAEMSKDHSEPHSH